MKQIADFEIIDHGIESSSYFQGCGVSFTDFEEVSTGIGDTASEALEDALESLAQGDWDTDSVKPEWHIEPKDQKGVCEGCEFSCDDDDDDDAKDCRDDCDPCDGCEMYHFVSIRVR